MGSREQNSTKINILNTEENGLLLPLQASIDYIIKEEGYLAHTILCRSISTNGGNFMANLFEVDIKGITKNGEKETNIFIKSKIEDSQLAVLDTDECYKTEIFFYDDLSKIYEDLQNEANISSEERLAMVKTYDASNPNAIFMENLCKKGFTTLHRMEVPPLKFVELSIQQLARFHGLSWVLEKKQPEYFKNIKTMRTHFKFGNDYQEFINNFSKYAIECADKETKQKLEKFKPRMLDTLRQRYNENDDVRCCLCHGDYRVNNILMKKDGVEITEVIPVDYQMLYYGCPVMDFHFFIVLCTDSEFRRKHLDKLKDLYHDTIDKFLKHFNMDVEKVYPRAEFEAEYEKRLDFGLITIILMAPFLFTNDDDVPDINKQSMASITATPDPIMYERVKGLLDDFQKWGVL